MQALGRTLQVIGWLWFIAGIVGPVFGFDRLNFFPGLILIFVARVIRAQSARTQSSEPQAEDPQSETAAPERILNTERRQPPPSPSPQLPSPSPQPTASYTPERRPEPEAKSGKTSEERSELLERIVTAGRGEAEPESPEKPEPMAEGADRAPMSSEEMIARAHRRWDAKKR